ncbi:MAG: cytochrome c biogenesis protein CcsA [Candidatus Cryptobacteroides sp.]|nr:cytochrome c biogenesis protein CcsA [Candidatus Cryptobacteroides sp.]
MTISSSDLAFPVSALLAAAFILVSFALHRYAGGSRVVRALRSPLCSRILLSLGAIGLAVEGTWSIPLHKSLPALIFALVLLLSLILTILWSVLPTEAPKPSPEPSPKPSPKSSPESGPNPGPGRTPASRRSLAYNLSHAGIAVIIFAALFGAPDITRARMKVSESQSISVARSDDGLLVPLPFAISLEQFVTELYPGTDSPRQYKSRILIDGRPAEVSVNHPLRHSGYHIYQDSYDREYAKFTVLQVVRDPWRPLMYLGIALLAAGAVVLLLGQWKSRQLIPAVLVLTLLFAFFSISRIEFGTLPPALRSWWFVPHLFIYMVAYSLMALALVIRLLPDSPRRRFAKQPAPDPAVIAPPPGTPGNSLATAEAPQSPADKRAELSRRLVRSSSALLILGMLCGSVWAGQAWGNLWAWDPKENWAAVTWLLSLLLLHLPQRRSLKSAIILILTFAALQITWYGVSYLPSAINSLHTYNQ